MNVILLLYGDEAAWAGLDEAATAQLYAEHAAFGAALEQAGVLRGGAELQPSATAVTLRFVAGRPRRTDGPYVETKEHLGGFYLIEVEDLAAAEAWAAKVPGMDGGGVEIRPLGMC